MPQLTTAKPWCFLFAKPAKPSMRIKPMDLNAFGADFARAINDLVDRRVDERMRDAMRFSKTVNTANPVETPEWMYTDEAANYTRFTERQLKSLRDARPNDFKIRYGERKRLMWWRPCLDKAVQESIRR
jgi:hypothetical protein